MAETMTGLFGPSPYEAQQQRMGQLDQAAQAYGQQDPMQRAAAGMYKAGGMLAGVGAQAFGGVDPNVANAQRTEQIMGQGNVDLSSSAGLLAKADEFRKAGDLRTATALTLKGNEMKKQEAAALLANRKEDRAQQKLEEVDKQRLENDYDLKKQQLTQALEIAKMRSEDSRLSVEQRAAAAKDADETKRYLGGLMAEMKRLGIEAKGGAGKPLTATQQAKLSKDQAASSAAIRAQDSEIESLGGDIAKVASSEYLGRATGARGVLPSMPGSEASKVEGQLDSIANRLKAQGLKVLREGGGIGAITEKEWDILANQVANIDRKRGAEYVKGELEKVNLRMKEMQRNATQRHYEQFGEEYSSSRDKPNTPVPGLPTQDAIAAEIARRQRGK